MRDDTFDKGTRFLDLGPVQAIKNQAAAVGGVCYSFAFVPLGGIGDAEVICRRNLGKTEQTQRLFLLIWQSF